MNKPIRIQRSRKHKQISPNGLPIVYAGRPSKYGNPFKLVNGSIYVDASYRRKLLDKWVYLCQGDEKQLMNLYNIVLTGKGEVNSLFISIDSNLIKDIFHWVKVFSTLDLSVLKNKNISCWCALNCKCHADVLLKIVNEL